MARIKIQIWILVPSLLIWVIMIEYLSERMREKYCFMHTIKSTKQPTSVSHLIGPFALPTVDFAIHIPSESHYCPKMVFQGVNRITPPQVYWLFCFIWMRRYPSIFVPPSTWPYFCYRGENNQHDWHRWWSSYMGNQVGGPVTDMSENAASGAAISIIYFQAIFSLLVHCTSLSSPYRALAHVAKIRWITHPLRVISLRMTELWFVVTTRVINICKATLHSLLPVLNLWLDECLSDITWPTSRSTTCVL